jgi:hypothetical protein
VTLRLYTGTSGISTSDSGGGGGGVSGRSTCSSFNLFSDGVDADVAAASARAVFALRFLLPDFDLRPDLP